MPDSKRPARRAEGVTAPTSSRTKDGGGRPAWFSTSAIFNTKAATDVSRVDPVVIRRELSPGKFISCLGATLRINQGLEGRGGVLLLGLLDVP